MQQPLRLIYSPFHEAHDDDYFLYDADDFLDYENIVETETGFLIHYASQ